VNRRGVLAGLAAAAAGVAVWRSPLLTPPPLPLTEMEQPNGYRRLKAGPVSLAGAVFAGLDGAAPDPLHDTRAAVAADLCAALFDSTPPGAVPTAYFYDYQCPICRRLTPRLRDLSGVALTWHDLAGLGPASELAARAAIAARAQGAFDAFHDRMMRAVFQPTDGYVTALAESTGIDAGRLTRDMQSAAVTDRLNRSRAVADLFGMAGTPGLVIGRTLVIGDVDDATLKRIVALEAATPGPCAYSISRNSRGSKHRNARSSAARGSEIPIRSFPETL